MAEAIGVASGIAALVAIAVQITKLSYSYISDVRKAPRAQKTYLQQVSALTEVLLRLEQALQDSAALGIVNTQPVSLSTKTISECRQQLDLQSSKLKAHIHRLVWPFEDRELKKAIDDLSQFRSIFADYIVANISVTSAATFRSVDALKLEQDKNQLLEWLQKPSSSSRVKPTALAGTGSWFLNHPQFRQFCTATPSILWCYGPPGVGKSMLASLAIDQLSSTSSSSGSCITYYFCDFTARKQQTEMAILQSILRQVISQADKDTISVLLRRREQIRSTPKSTDLSLALADVCSVLKDTYVIFDAADELEKPKQSLTHLKSLVDAGWRILVTSRDHPDLREAFSTARQIETRASSEDLTKYVKHRFEESDFRDMAGSIHSIVDTVVGKANGLLLLAKLLMDQLLELPSIKKMRRSLEFLPSKLNEAFESSVERIDAEPRELRDIAYRLINWIVFAERPLQALELIHAFAIEPEDDEIDPENLTKLQTLLRIGAGLIVLDNDRNTLGLVHLSAYEFFQMHGERHSVHEDIARTSLRYLCVRALQTGRCLSIDDMGDRLDEFSFLGYAARNWGKHILDQEIEEKLKEPICKLLKDSNLRSSSFQVLHYREEIKDRDLATAALETIPWGQSQLHIAAYWGLERTTKGLLEAGEDVNSIDSQRWTPLHWAASNGHVAIMTALLEAGAEVDPLDAQNWTPLFWASLKGNGPALRLLLDRSAKHLSRDVHGWTALHWAVSRGQEESVIILLKHHAVYLANRKRLSLRSIILGTDEGSNAPYSKTPLEVAAEAKNIDLFNTLLQNQRETNEKSFNVSWPSGHFDPPMSNAWRIMNKAEIIHGVENYMSKYRWVRSDKNNSPENSKWKAIMLHSAIKDGKLSVMQLLVETGVDVNYSLGRSPLHAAAFRKDPEFARILLRHGADVFCEDLYGQTPLHQAVLNGFEKTVSILLQHGSDPNARRKSKVDRMRRQSVRGQTPLMLACGLKTNSLDDSEAQAEIIDLLIAHGADTSLQDAKSRNGLHYAAMSGNLDIARKVICSSVDVNAVDEEGISPLHHASRSCNVDMVRLMIDHGADTTLIDKYGRSAIHFLAEGDENGFRLGDLKCIFDLLNSAADRRMLDAEYDSVEAGGGWWTTGTLRRHTAISVAIERRNWKVFQILKESNATLPKELGELLSAAVGALQPSAVHFLLEHGVNLNRALDHLHHAIQRCHSTLDAMNLELVLKELIDLGLDVNERSFGVNETILHIAAGHSDSLVADVLLRNGFDPYVTARGFDPFLIAAIHGNSKFLHALLTNAPTVPPEGHWLENFNLCSENNFDDLTGVCEALARSAQLERVDENGRSLLMAAIDADNHQLVERLLVHGANIEASNEHGWSPLHYAVLRGHKAICASLLKAGANVNASTETWAISYAPRPSGLAKGDQWTGRALHLAVLMGHTQIVTILLDHGADVDATTGAGVKGSILSPGHGPTALHIALDTGGSYGLPVRNLDDGRLSIARMLIESGACVDTVADHITMNDLECFKGYEDVWNKVRLGISEARG